MAPFNQNGVMTSITGVSVGGLEPNNQKSFDFTHNHHHNKSMEGHSSDVPLIEEIPDGYENGLEAVGPQNLVNSFTDKKASS